MPSLNKLLLIGHLGADPEIRFLPSGDAVARFSVATSDARSDGKGGYALLTNWHQVVVYGKRAEVACKYLRKGSQIYVEGRLLATTWTDRAGVVRKSWKVVADRVQMLGKPVARNQHVAAANDDVDEMAWLNESPAETDASGPGEQPPVTDEDDDPTFGRDSLCPRRPGAPTTEYRA